MTPRFVSRLLEREHETALLTRAWRDARAGRGSTWLLCAEAGGGKTRLATEFTRACGARTLWGAAEPLSPPDPYLAVLAALPSFQPAPTRAGSVAAALTALDQAAGAGPVVVVLDDLHFADEGTIAATVRLSSACATRPWLVLATFRPNEGSPELLAPLTEVVAQGAARRLDLAPLSGGAVAALVADVRGTPPEPGEARAIHTDSGGNPWFAEALARGNGTMAATRDRILLRLDRIERAIPGAHDLLRALAPAGEPLPHPVVTALAGGDSPVLRRTLGALRDAGVLREEDNRWQFRHELLRRSLFEQMIAADQRDAHRALAQALEGQGSTAALAMHYAAAGDARAVDWALRAAAEARAIDAHTEALAQLERALSFAMEPERRRAALRDAAVEAYDLSRWDDIERFVNEAIAIPGCEPEVLATLHQHGARAAYHRGDPEADDAHLAAAERALAGRPVGREAVSIATARVARAAVYVQPVRLAAAAEHALRLAYTLDDEAAAAVVVTQIKSFTVVSLLDCGDPAGLDLLEEVTHLADQHHLPGGVSATALLNAYESSVLSLFHETATLLHERTLDAFRRHELGWQPWIAPYRVLELVQRGRYEEARALAGAITAPEAGNLNTVVLSCAGALREVRGGSLDQARAVLAASKTERGFQQAALIDLVRLELAMLIGDPGLGELAQGVYGRMNRHHYARVAGVAAVGLARSGRGAPQPPPWLVADTPLRVLWEWAAGIDRHDIAVLREVAARLTALPCPYEAALALRDAGERGAAYRALRALGATTAREQVAEELRIRGEHIPRRSRSALDPDGLTETERQVCRLVVTGATNEQVAARLAVSVHTVETHLTHIYQKTGQRGRAALIAWWLHRTSEPAVP